MNVYDILNLLGGIALFLFGMHTLSASLEKLAGGKLETWLEKATSKPIKGVVLGAIITAVIQSSAATTVMIIGRQQRNHRYKLAAQPSVDKRLGRIQLPEPS